MSLWQIKEMESIPFGTIVDVEQSSGSEGLILQCKDFRTLYIYCKGNVSSSERNPEKRRAQQQEDQKNLRRDLRIHLSQVSMNSHFAFHNKERFRLDSELAGWPIYDHKKEFKRQNIPPDRWKYIENNNFKLSPNYPQWILVPSRVDNVNTIAYLTSINNWFIMLILFFHAEIGGPSSGLAPQEVLSCTHLETSPV